LGNTELCAARERLRSRRAYRCVFPPFASTSALRPFQRPVGLAPKSDISLGVNELVGTKAVSYSAISAWLDALNKQSELYSSFVAFTLAGSTPSAYRDRFSSVYALFV